MNSRATPLADEDLSNRLLDLIKECSGLKQIKKGGNESTKTLNRGISEMIVMAADAQPLEILLHLPLLCEDKNVPFVFVPSKAQLGKACNSSRNVIACSLLKFRDSKLTTKIQKMVDEVERLYLAAAPSNEYQ